jgi:hypothetical protein
MQNKKREWRILIVVLAAFFWTCSRGPSGSGELTAEQIVALNSAPQNEYPEFTLEKQREAMQRLEELRRRARVEGLREKTPPADWIQLAYHGLVLDANYDVIELNPETVSKIQESMFSVLQQSARAKAVERFGSDLSELFNEQRLQGQEKLAVRTVVLDALLGEADETLRARYEWRHRLLRSGAPTRIDSKLLLSPAATELLQRRGLREELFDEPLQASRYVETCRAQGVPIPPDWPNPRWISQGPLALVFISQGLDAEVFAFKDPSVPGVCYALPRRSGTSIELLGIICQSDTTGKVCFWDNKTVENVKITGPDVRLDIDTISNGFTLDENCTECHRGDNAFNIHPGTALQLQRPGAPGGPYDTSIGPPAVRYAPIGQATWSNPGPLILTAPPAGQLSCLSCHGLPQTAGSFYCSSVLETAARTTMPPFGSPAGWPTGGGTVGPLFADHIRQLSACP